MTNLCRTFHPDYLSERGPLVWGFSTAAAFVPLQGNIRLASLGTNFVAIENTTRNLFPIWLDPAQEFFTPERLGGKRNPSIRTSDVRPTNCVLLATDGIVRKRDFFHFGFFGQAFDLRQPAQLKQGEGEGLYLIVRPPSSPSST